MRKTEKGRRSPATGPEEVRAGKGRRLDPEKARELQRRSAEARKRNAEARRREEEEAASFCRILKRILRSRYEDPETGEEQTFGEGVNKAIVLKALAGDVNAFKTIRDTIGETPVARAEVSGRDGAALPFPPLSIEIIDSRARICAPEGKEGTR